MKHLNYYQLLIQPYFISTKISTRMKKQLFRFRTRMTNVGHNFGRKVACPLCNSGNDDQEHLFNCIIIKLNNANLYKSTEEKYEDIYSMNSDKLINIARLCESIIRTREILTAYMPITRQN